MLKVALFVRIAFVFIRGPSFSAAVRHRCSVCSGKRGRERAKNICLPVPWNNEHHTAACQGCESGVIFVSYDVKLFSFFYKRKRRTETLPITLMILRKYRILKNIEELFFRESFLFGFVSTFRQTK